MTSSSPISAPPAAAPPPMPASLPATSPRTTARFAPTGGLDVIVWYIAMCYRCGDGGEGMAQPFLDEDARDEWAIGHLSTSHVVHLSIDAEVEPGQVLADLHMTAMLKRDVSDAPGTRWLCPAHGCKRWSDPYVTPQLAIAAWRTHHGVRS